MGGASVCWRRLHNLLETKCIKSGAKSPFSLSFLASTLNDVTRKLYTIGTQSTVEKRAKRMPDIIVETTILSTITEEPSCGVAWYRGQRISLAIQRFWGLNPSSAIGGLFSFFRERKLYFRLHLCLGPNCGLDLVLKWCRNRNV